MEWFSLEVWSALLAIIMIDLVLAGDNAIVIGLAVRRPAMLAGTSQCCQEGRAPATAGSKN